MLLEPFAIHTNQLQTDSKSRSDVVPCFLNFETHLQSTTVAKQLAQVLLKSLRERFGCILIPLAANINTNPAAPCLIDPSVSLPLRSTKMETLMRQAESFALQQIRQYSRGAAGCQGDASPINPASFSTRLFRNIASSHRRLCLRSPSSRRVNLAGH